MASLPSPPPFPDGYLECPLLRISLAKLCSEPCDEKEAARLVEACRSTGFFYLDLSDDRSESTLGKDLLEDALQLVALSKDAFKLPQEEKDKYTLKNRVFFGYKPRGLAPKENPDGSKAVPDGVEFFNVARDHVLGQSAETGSASNSSATAWAGDDPARFYPPLLLSQINLFHSYITACEIIARRVLETLGKGLKVDAQQLVKMHQGNSSDSMLRLTQTLRDVFADGDDGANTPPHSDFGSVTVLFNWIGGLQIQLPPGIADAAGNVADKPRWAYVRPLKNHAVINLGDAMVTFTKGKLRSGPHKVIAPPGEHRNFDRYSIVYFLRPQDHVKMAPLKEFRDEGETEDDAMTTKEWVTNKVVKIGALKD